jgi:hypothetical protein
LGPFIVSMSAGHDPNLEGASLEKAAAFEA